MRGCNKSNVSGQKKKKKSGYFSTYKAKKTKPSQSKKFRQNVFCFLFFFDKMFLIKMIKPIFKKFSESCLIYNE